MTIIQPTAPSSSASPLPDAILQTGFSFWSAKVLLTAVRFGLFSRLAGRTATGAELGRELELHPRGTGDFLDALVALGFLQRHGDGEKARYENTPATRLWLDERSPHYLGGVLVMLDARLYRCWDDLPTALRTGRPQNEARDGGESIFATLYRDPAQLEQFLGAMSGLSRVHSRAFAAAFDFSGVRTLCDAGGATGLLSIEVARRHEHVRCTSFDLPAVQPIAERHVAAAGLADRVRVVAGDFFHVPLPPADVITMSMVLHDWNLERKLALIQKAWDALPPGGALVTIEMLIDDARRTNVQGLLMSLNMLIEFGDAFDYSARDFEGWCRQVGFRRFDRLPLQGPCSAAIAWK